MTHLVILTGLSGSGKSSALNALEDLGYYAIDNLPIKLLETFLELVSASGSEINKIALVMDLRDQSFAQNYPTVFKRVLDSNKNVEIVFFDASDETLTRRFNETRRKHPVSASSVEEGIRAEREALADLKDIATTVFDTSDMHIHELKKKIIERYAYEQTNEMQIRFISFGFKHGAPKNCDIILDVRFLSNPHFVRELKELCGKDKAVQDFINQDDRAEEFFKRTVDYLDFLIPNYKKEGKRYLSIGIGCTGGQHRSVYMAEKLAQKYSKNGPSSSEHKDLSRN